MQGPELPSSPLSSLPSEAKIEEEQQQKQLLSQEEFARLESVVMRFRAEGRVFWLVLLGKVTLSVTPLETRRL